MVQFKQILPSALMVFSVLGAPMVMAEVPAPPPHHEQKKGGEEDGNYVERHISHLHDALKVTAQQEEQWKPVAQVMRDNAKTLHELVQEKRAKDDGQTAVEDLTAYSEIVEAHSQGTKKLVQVFGTFYSGLNDEQKKVADDFFREHKRHADRHHGPKSDGKQSEHH